jgi:hypothetical protein
MAASKWYKITNVVDADGAGQRIADGTFNAQGGHVFKECDIDLAGTTEVFTEPFDFPIMGDFSIVVNTSGVDIDNNYSGAACKIAVYGSVDNVNWTDALDSTTNKDFDGKPYVHVYDYDEEGRMPFMRIGLDGNGSGTNKIKVAVIPH